MRDTGSPAELERRRFLAVRRVLEGYSTEEVAEFLGVDSRSVRRWVAAYRGQGERGLLSRPASGRPPQRTLLQEKIVRRWLADSPMDHGFETELWTALRLARLIREEFGIELNSRYLSTWLRDRGFSPQKPQRVPRERDPEAIAAWLESGWPRLKKSATAGSPNRPDRRERAPDGPAGPPHLVAAGADPVPDPAWRPPSEGLGRGCLGAVAASGPAGAVRASAGRRLHSTTGT